MDYLLEDAIGLDKIHDETLSFVKNTIIGNQQHCEQFFLVIDEMDAAVSAQKTADFVCKTIVGACREAVVEVARQIKNTIHGVEEISWDTDDFICDKIDEILEDFIPQ